MKLKPFPTERGPLPIIKAASSAVQDSGFGTQGLSAKVICENFLLSTETDSDSVGLRWESVESAHSYHHGFSLLLSVNLIKRLKQPRATQQMLPRGRVDGQSQFLPLVERNISVPHLTPLHSLASHSFLEQLSLAPPISVLQLQDLGSDSCKKRVMLAIENSFIGLL